MASAPPTAAESLTGMSLPGGWLVDKKLDKSTNATGGIFSVGYLVSKEDNKSKGFLKALDLSLALNAPDVLKELQFLTTGFNFEREMLEVCQKNRLDRVVTAIADGTVVVPGNIPIKQVPYLIFELADGDVRARFELEKAIDIPWRLRSLHQIAIGLGQLHKNGISHQDMKPSNVLVFEARESKIADLGRAVTSGKTSPFDGFRIAGDQTYAPPELLYGYFDPEWNVRRLVCDAYHLGSLAMFFFCDATMTAAMLSKLDPAHLPTQWGGSFQDVLPYLADAFSQVLADFTAEIRNIEPKLDPELVQIVKELCEPNCLLRGDAQARRRNVGNPFSLERYISRLDRLAHRAAAGTL